MGFGLAAGAYTDAPTLPTEQNKALRRKQDGSGWEVVDDFREKLAYSTETGQSTMIDYIGPLADGWTLMPPKTSFDKWDGSQWVTDTDAQHAAAVSSAQTEQESRTREAETVIQKLTLAVKYDMATDEEKASLEAWGKYFVLLSRVNPENAPDINWPPVPDYVG